LLVSRNRVRADRRRRGNRIVKLVSVVAIALVAVAFSAAAASASTDSPMYNRDSRTNFAFISPHIAGAPTGAVAMAGFGSYDTTASTLHANGLFRCTSSVAQGPLTGCMTGQGVRWSSDTLLASVPFKCVGGAEALKTGTTSADTVAFQAKFFRAGDGQNASFTANVIVSRHDIAPDIPGVQNTWIQNVGCGSALVAFGH
jgi:hypothetical protein